MIACPGCGQHIVLLGLIEVGRWFKCSNCGATTEFVADDSPIGTPVGLPETSEPRGGE